MFEGRQLAEGKDNPLVTPVLIGWLKTNVPREAMSDVAPSAKAMVELAQQDNSLLTPEEWKESKDLPRLPRFVAMPSISAQAFTWLCLLRAGIAKQIGPWILIILSFKP
jgi:hypothetical protein